MRSPVMFSKMPFICDAYVFLSVSCFFFFFSPRFYYVCLKLEEPVLTLVCWMSSMSTISYIYIVKMTSSLWDLKTCLRELLKACLKGGNNVEKNVPLTASAIRSSPGLHGQAIVDGVVAGLQRGELHDARSHHR